MARCRCRSCWTRRRIEWEADIAWIIRGGADPTDWIARHGERITAVHVKDIAAAGRGRRRGRLGRCRPWHRGLGRPVHGRVALPKTPARLFIMEHDNPSDAAGSRRDPSTGCATEQRSNGHGNEHTWCRHHRMRQYLDRLSALAPLFRGIEVRACADINPEGGGRPGRRNTASGPKPSRICSPPTTST
jgi:hypothetical protein